ncbi:MAG: UDP-N-acetylmuramate dehydrogenase [Candidatus Andersenbacteria bacterium]
MQTDITHKIQKNISLSDFTTIKLGGVASEFISCASNQDIISALEYATQKNIPVHVLGGGSNTIFQDTGFAGLVIYIKTSGISHEEQSSGTVLLTAQAGENWDDVVQYAVTLGAVGIECLSSIPGSCGGTPFQNVGAYGQDVSQTIQTVHVIERSTGKQLQFSNSECQFGYRTSKFKTTDRDKYIITQVVFKLEKNKTPEIKYPELEKMIGHSNTQGVAVKLRANNAKLVQIRTAVLALRKKKSMLIDSTDPNSISCGSFFTNPIIPKTDFENNAVLKNSDIPKFPTDDNSNTMLKLSAGWLIEHAGFSKGMKQGSVGISDNHSLALVNRGGTTQELLDFAHHIQKTVQQKFGIKLELEPVVVM